MLLARLQQLARRGLAQIGILIFFWLLALALYCATAFQAHITDNFHEGEYLGLYWQIKAYLASGSGFPFLVHGAMDYLPHFLAAELVTGERFVVGTRFINVAVATISVALFGAIAYNALGQAKWFTKGLIVAGAIWLFAPGPNSSAVVVQQAPLGTRNLFLLLTLYLICLPSRGRVRDVAIGVCTAFAIVWSYDRGIATAVGVLGFVLALMRNGERQAAGRIVVGGALGGAVLLAVPILGAYYHLRNVAYWVRNQAEIWKFPFSIDPMSFVSATPVFLLCAAAVASAIPHALRFKRAEPIVAALVGVQLLLMYKVAELPMAPYSAFAAWPAFLLLAFCWADVLAGMEEGLIRAARLQPGRIYLMVGTALCAVLVPMVYAVFTAYSRDRTIPLDFNLVSGDVNKVAEILSKNECVFDLTNEGVLTFLAKKPNCTEFPYAVYIAKDRQIDVLQQLKSKNVQAIVTKTKNWSYAIYGSDMDKRVPKLVAYIKEHFPRTVAVGDFEVSMRPPLLPQGPCRPQSVCDDDQAPD